MATSQAKRGRPKGGPGESAPRVGHLDTLGGVLAEMRAVYREARLGKTPLEEATKLTYILKEMRAGLEAMAIEEIQQKLRELDARVINGGRLNGHQIEARPIDRTD
jgi:hypothetical protein